MKPLSILYKKSTKGTLQWWSICADGNVIITKWGQIDGAVQETRDVITKGKNIGKKNETTPEEQAEAEAVAQWEKKLKKGYVKTKQEAEAGKKDAIITGGVDVMLAHRFDQHGHKLTYPCYVQPKLDGTRCTAVVDDDGEVTLWSRTRKPITSMGHIADAIKELCCKPGTVFDGELYSHNYRDNFEQLISFIRDTEAKPGSEAVEFHIYDLASASHPFHERIASLEIVSIDFSSPTSPLKLVETLLVDNEDVLLDVFQGYLKQGYEGAIARNADGLYVGKRSYDLLKIKEFQDAEFEVVGVEEGRGKLAGHAIFVCKTDDGAEFRAKMVGSTDELKQYWNDPSLAIGRQLTVKFFGLTNKNGVPRFPVALRFRDE